MRRLGAILAGIALTLGLKYYNKTTDAGDVHKHLVSLCEGDKGCESAVSAHFDECFESAYKMGGRYSPSQLAGGELVKCINSKSGREYFSYSEKGE
jgi:hypothetical protein